MTQLSVYVLGREVATLAPSGDFKSVLSYHPQMAADDFVSLTMPVRTESYVWDDQLPPVLQMNLPEGYLLQVLQERFGPHIGASPVALLSVIGRNMVGRLQVAAPGAELDEPPKPIEVAALLKGDNSEAAFAMLVREHATSGVSGVVPKFLDAEEPTPLADHKKASLVTRRHIVKGSSTQLPFVALNEHLCMQVARRVTPTAITQVSDDGQALVVHRFDVDEQGQPRWGMEDFCSLLGLRPAAKYDTTWERIAKAVRDHVPGTQRLDTFRQLATILLLTYALRNADCHAKNLALRYTSRADVHLSPAYDILRRVCTQAFSTTRPVSNSWARRPGRQARTCNASSPPPSASSPKSSSTWFRPSAMPWRTWGRKCAKPWRSTPGLKTSANACCWHGPKAFRDCGTSASMPWAAGRRALPLKASLHHRSRKPRVLRLADPHCWESADASVKSA